MMQRLIPALLTATSISLSLFACDGGVAGNVLPPAETTEPGTTNPERPVSESDRPTTNPEDPTGNPEAPSKPITGTPGGEAGSGPGDNGNGGNPGNPGPGNGCTLANQCSGCDSNCDACHCAGVDDDICDQLCP